MELYKYVAFRQNFKKQGYVFAENKINAFQLLKRNEFTPIMIRRVYFFSFNRVFVIKWFDSLSKLIKSGFNIEDSLLIISQEKEIVDIYVNIIDSLKLGKTFAEILIENERFFGVESTLIASYLCNHTSVDDLCQFLYEYHLFILNVSDNIKKSLYMPIFSFILCLGTFCFILLLFLSNFDLINEIMKDKNSYMLIILGFIKNMGLVKFLLIFFGALLVCFNYFILQGSFFREYQLNREYCLICYAVYRYLSYGLHLIHCLDVVKKVTKNQDVIKEIEILGCNLNKGNSLFKSFSNLSYLIKYTHVTNVYESCGKVPDLFLFIFKNEESLISKKLNFLQNFLPVVFFLLSALIVIVSFVFVLCGLLDFNIGGFYNNELC